ncbi:unnamed protein product [Sphacelaria rigidula]
MHLALDMGGVSMFVVEVGHSMYKGAEKAHARLHLNVEDPMSVAEKMVKAGCKTITKCEKQFWGSIYGEFEDPFGLVWSVSDTTTPIEDVPKELQSKLMPFAMVHNATEYIKFLQDVLDATPTMEPVKQSNGKIMWAELMINGGKCAVSDQCCDEANWTMTITTTVPTGQAQSVCDAFKAGGGKILDRPSPQFWGQVWGRCKDAFGQDWGVCEPPSGPPPSKEDMAIDIQFGEKYQWQWSWVIEDVPKMYCFGQVRTSLTEGSEISAACAEMIPVASAEAGKRGLQSVGPPICGYFAWDPKEGGETKLTVGVNVAGDSSHVEAAEGDDGFGIRSLGGVKCATVTHVGPYSELKGVYNATFEWIAARGYESKMPVVEIHEDGPPDVEPANFRTKICVPIVRK